MIDERGIGLRYLKAQKKRTLLLVFGVVLSVALVTALFSVFSAFQQFEVLQEGATAAWHVLAQECSPDQARQLQKRADVSFSGLSQPNAATGFVAGSEAAESSDKIIKGALGGYDNNGATLAQRIVVKGRLPKTDSEIALEQWVLDKIKPGAKTGDTVEFVQKNGQALEFTLCGILKNNSAYQRSQFALAVISLSRSKALLGTDKVNVAMQVQENVKIKSFVSNIKKDQNLGKDVITNDDLLAVLGRSDNQNSRQVYLVAGFLALLVMIAAIVMIYNAFHISVTHRVRQFGLLRAIGATPKQIRRTVRSEAFWVCVLGIVPGILIGVLVTGILLILLKHIAPDFFLEEGPSFVLSVPSILVGAASGAITVFLSSFAPARKASKISPVQALTNVSQKSIRKKRSGGIATKLLPVEAAFSVRQVFTHKKSSLLTALSLSFGILLLLTFSTMMTLIQFGTDRNSDFSDIYAYTSKPGTFFSKEQLNSIREIPGVAGLSPRRLDKVDATFSYSLLGNEYSQSIVDKQIKWSKVGKDSNGNIIAASQSSLAGLQDSDIASLSHLLVFGKLDPAQITRENGVVVALNSRSSYSSALNDGDLRPGEYISVHTAKGSGKLKICAVIRSCSIIYPYDEFNNNLPFLSLLTTDSVFEKYSSAAPNLLAVSLSQGTNTDDVYTQFTSKFDNGFATTGNMATSKHFTDEITVAGNVFVWGFTLVIALIGILNIVNTMNTNIIVRTQEIGLLRAGGMTMGQAGAMVTVESVLYGVAALIIGLGAGIPLARKFYDLTVKCYFAVPWAAPWAIIFVSAAFTLLSVVLSVILPMKQIRRTAITECVTSE